MPRKLMQYSAVCLLLLLQSATIIQATNFRGGDDIGEARALQLEESPAPSEWTREFVEQLRFATLLGWIVKEEGITTEETSVKYNDIYQRFRSFNDRINDVTIVVKEKDVCYVVFQAQRRQNILDVLQTLNPLIKRNAFGTNCDVRRSFFNGYETNYADDLRVEIHSCVKSCNGEDCPLIITGNSVGASIALVASLDPLLQQYNPTTLTIGPLRAIINEDCTDLNTSSIYRIVSSNAGYYDAASDGSPKRGYHVGHTYLVDETSHFAYIGYNDKKLRFPDDYNIHTVETYLERIDKLRAKDDSQYPIDHSLYQDGHWCTEHDECISGTCGDLGYCTNPAAASAVVMLGPGSSCTLDTDCQGGSLCHWGMCSMPSGLGGTGAPCNAHEECESQRCVVGDDTDDVVPRCLPKQFTGNWCMQDVDCGSNFCGGEKSWLGKFKCLPNPELLGAGDP